MISLFNFVPSFGLKKIRVVWGHLTLLRARIAQLIEDWEKLLLMTHIPCWAGATEIKGIWVCVS